MRTICEACSLPQPTDWRAGDLCVHCGKATRAESRCFWCTRWTPDGKYCRHCGAETVEERLFAAARMLKDAGTDRFTVPKMLQELPPDQVENFTYIYQRHGIVLARHIDDLIFLEKYLHQQQWSIDLEDQLIKDLPWSDEVVNRYTMAPLSPQGDLERVREIHRLSPFESTRALAAMVALRLGLENYKPLPPQHLPNDLPITMTSRSGDLPPGKELLLEVREALHYPEAQIRLEAALTLSHWRVLYSFGFPESRQDIFRELSQSNLFAAQVGRALMGDTVELQYQTTTITNPDLEFATALVSGDVDRLRAEMASERLRRLAAGLKLSDLGVYEPLAETLLTGDPELQWLLLQSISGNRRKKGPVPQLRDVFYQLLEESTYSRIVETSARMLSLEAENVNVMRILRAVENNPSGLQSLLQSDLVKEDANAIAARLVELEQFKMSQYGLADLAKGGKVSDSFVSSQFPLASDSIRDQLCQFAEVQLLERGDEELHHFMIGVVLGPYSASIRGTAWSCLQRWYSRQEYGSTGPLKVSKEPVERFFGSMEVFLEKLINVLEDQSTLKEIGYAEFMSKLLKYHDDEVLPELVKEERLSMRLKEVLLQVMRNPELWMLLRCSCADLLSLLAMHDEWVVEISRDLGSFKGTDMEGASTIALDRICRQYEDLGEGDGRNPRPSEEDFDWQAMLEREDNTDPR
jgi:hypothetical protein